MQIQKKVHFQYSDLNDSEYFQLCKVLVEIMPCCATHRIDVGKSSTSFRIRIKPDAELQTQRPTKLDIHFRDKLNTILEDLPKKNRITKQIGSTPHEKFLELLFGVI